MNAVFFFLLSFDSDVADGILTKFMITAINKDKETERERKDKDI